MEGTVTRNAEHQQHSDVVPNQETSIQIIFREIHKNAWLRRLTPSGDRKPNGGAYSKRGENVWVVFCVHDDRDPYLEVYEDQKVAAAHRPDWCAPLASCLHVTPTICASHDGHHEFVVTLRTGIVKLAAPSWDIMMEWVSTLRSKLEEMKILSPPENVYSQLPQMPRGPLLPTRDPNSPLPPTPAGPRSLVPGTEMAALPDTAQEGSNVALSISHDAFEVPTAVTTVSITSGQAVSPLIPITPRVSTRVPPIMSPRQTPATTSLYITHSDPPPVLTRLPAAAAAIQATSVISEQNITVIEVDGPSTDPHLNNVFDFSFMGTSLQEATSTYERLYLSETTSTQANSQSEPVSPEVSRCNESSRNEDMAVTPTRTQIESSRNIRSQDLRGHRRRGPRLVPIPLEPRRILQPVPHPFRPPLPSPPQAILTLREQQILHLSREMNHPGGVRVQLRKKDCCNGSIALVDAFCAVWVAGWKQREHPKLYSALHIGDRLLSVDGMLLPNATEAHKIIRAATGLYVEFVVRRVPFGRVFAIRRELEGQDLGLELESGTAEIKLVRPLSLAARAGLPPRGPTCDGLSLTNWVLTEVNNRPLNLFFKDGEVRDRLNAVGKPSKAVPSKRSNRSGYNVASIVNK